MQCLIISNMITIYHIIILVITKTYFRIYIMSSPIQATFYHTNLAHASACPKVLCFLIQHLHQIASPSASGVRLRIRRWAFDAGGENDGWCHTQRPRKPMAETKMLQFSTNHLWFFCSSNLIFRFSAHDTRKMCCQRSLPFAGSSSTSSKSWSNKSSCFSHQRRFFVPKLRLAPGVSQAFWAPSSLRQKCARFLSERLQLWLLSDWFMMIHDDSCSICF